MKNAIQITPKLASVVKLRKVNDTLNTAMADISDIQVQLEKPTTFLYDTLSGFFDYYETLEPRDINSLMCMWYAAQSYKVYIESTLEYILEIAEKLDNVHELLSKEFNALNGGVDI